MDGLSFIARACRMTGIGLFALIAINLAPIMLQSQGQAVAQTLSGAGTVTPDITYQNGKVSINGLTTEMPLDAAQVIINGLFIPSSLQRSSLYGDDGSKALWFQGVDRNGVKLEVLLTYGTQNNVPTVYYLNVTHKCGTNCPSFSGIVSGLKASLGQVASPVPVFSEWNFDRGGKLITDKTTIHICGEFSTPESLDDDSSNPYALGAVEVLFNDGDAEKALQDCGQAFVAGSSTGSYDFSEYNFAAYWTTPEAKTYYTSFQQAAAQQKQAQQATDKANQQEAEQDEMYSDIVRLAFLAGIGLFGFFFWAQYKVGKYNFENMTDGGVVQHKSYGSAVRRNFFMMIARVAGLVGGILIAVCGVIVWHIGLF